MGHAHFSRCKDSRWRGLMRTTAQHVARHPFVRKSGGDGDVCKQGEQGMCVEFRQSRLQCFQNMRLPEDSPGREGSWSRTIQEVAARPTKLAQARHTYSRSGEVVLSLRSTALIATGVPTDDGGTANTHCG